MKRTIFLNISILSILLIILNIICWGILFYKENNYKKNIAKLPAMINENYNEIQEEWYSLRTNYQPFSGWQRDSFAGEFIHINNNGIRKTVTSNKEGSVVRFFGGSTMWGARVEDKHTIPSWFALCSSKKYQVVNHGETGFNSRQNLARLINILVKKDSTDLVVFYDGVNDTNFLCNAAISIPGHMRELQFKNTLMTQNSTQSYFKANNTIYSHGTELIYKIFLENTKILVDKVIRKYTTKQNDLNYVCHFDRQRAELVANHLLRCWELAHDLTLARGINFIAILQPNTFVDLAKDDYIENQLGELAEENFKMVYNLLREKIKERNYSWIYDFSHVLDGSESPIYYDFCHLNEEGNKIIADNICSIIDKINL